MKKISLVLALVLSLFSFSLSGYAADSSEEEPVQNSSGYKGIIPAPAIDKDGILMDIYTCNTTTPRRIPNPDYDSNATEGEAAQEYFYRFFDPDKDDPKLPSDPKYTSSGVSSELATTEKDRRLKLMSLGAKIQGGCVQLTDLPLIIIHLIDLCTKLAGSVAVLFILYAGFQLIMSGLTEDREAAKNTLKWAIIGLVVCLLSWLIVNLIQSQLTV